MPNKKEKLNLVLLLDQVLDENTYLSYLSNGLGYDRAIFILEYIVKQFNADCEEYKFSTKQTEMFTEHYMNIHQLLGVMFNRLHPDETITNSDQYFEALGLVNDKLLEFSQFLVGVYSKKNKIYANHVIILIVELINNLIAPPSNV